MKQTALFFLRNCLTKSDKLISNKVSPFDRIKLLSSFLALYNAPEVPNLFFSLIHFILAPYNVLLWNFF